MKAGNGQIDARLRIVIEPNVAPPSRRSVARSLLAGLALAVGPVGAKALARDPNADMPVVAAASDLQFALAEVAAAFTDATGHVVRLAMGSSGNFARQIRQGAPFQLYLSADERYVTDLAREGYLRDGGSLYAVGRIVLFVPHGSPLTADGSLTDLRDAIADGRVTRFAIANPEHAPYGRRAEEALRKLGLWEAIRPKLVLGENVSQAAQFAASPDTQGGILAYSLALSPRVSALGAYGLIPEHLHSPLRQRMALVKNAGPVAERFYGFIEQPAARAVLARHGFVLPAEGG